MRSILIGLVVVLVALGAFVFIARATSKPVDGIPCDLSEQVTYHVHAHLTIVLAGSRKLVYPPAGVGIHPEHLCLYWLHTHDATGVIHIEAGHRISPTLGQFFDIWGQPLSRTTVGRYTAASGAERVYLGQALYHGNPREIVLRNHTQITIELGPPYMKPPYFDFSVYGL
ncbi:MAG TPA: hypothetical protein VKX16_15830 [Chloroflexota bacterium]|nr:hypothetical protein [Chloroflexota bacterium]